MARSARTDVVDDDLGTSGSSPSSQVVEEAEACSMDKVAELGEAGSDGDVIDTGAGRGLVERGGESVDAADFGPPATIPRAGRTRTTRRR